MIPTTLPPLLRLPPELRLRIYDYLFESEVHISVYFAGGNLFEPSANNFHPLALARVCKQTRKEIPDHVITKRYLHVHITFSGVRHRKKLGKSLGLVRDCSFLYRATYVALYYDWEPTTGGGTALTFHRIGSVLKALPKIPNLTTLDRRAIDEHWWCMESEEMKSLGREVERKLSQTGVQIVYSPHESHYGVGPTPYAGRYALGLKRFETELSNEAWDAEQARIDEETRMHE